MGKVLSQPSLGDTTHAVVPIETRVPDLLILLSHRISQTHSVPGERDIKLAQSMTRF